MNMLKLKVCATILVGCASMGTITTGAKYPQNPYYMAGYNAYSHRHPVFLVVFKLGLWAVFLQEPPTSHAFKDAFAKVKYVFQGAYDFENDVRDEMVGRMERNLPEVVAAIKRGKEEKERSSETRNSLQHPQSLEELFIQSDDLASTFCKMGEIIVLDGPRDDYNEMNRSPRVLVEASPESPCYKKAYKLTTKILSSLGDFSLEEIPLSLLNSTIQEYFNFCVTLSSSGNEESLKNLSEVC